MVLSQNNTQFELKVRVFENFHWKDVILPTKIHFYCNENSVIKDLQFKFREKSIFVEKLFLFYLPSPHKLDEVEVYCICTFESILCFNQKYFECRVKNVLMVILNGAYRSQFNYGMFFTLHGWKNNWGSWVSCVCCIRMQYSCKYNVIRFLVIWVSTNRISWIIHLYNSKWVIQF